METNHSNGLPRSENTRARQPRVLSEEQELILSIRKKISRHENPNQSFDLRILDVSRRTNRSDLDLMVAFGNLAGIYMLDSIQRLHQALKNAGIENPSRFIDSEAMDFFTYHVPPTYFSAGPPIRPETIDLLVYALTSVDDRQLIIEIMQKRKIRDIEKVKELVAEAGNSHRSLSLGAL